MVVGAFVLALAGAPGLAAPVPSQTTCAAPEKVEASVVAAEREMVKGALMGFGLSETKAAERVALLSDAEVHAIAADLASLQAAGDIAHEQWDTTTVLLLLILIAIIA
jgi:hypothetical protein